MIKMIATDVDISMLKQAGRSYAVANARDEVKAAASHICGPYYEDGVLQVLKEILEGKIE